MGKISMFSKVKIKVDISAISIGMLISMSASAYNIDTSWTRSSTSAIYGVATSFGNKFEYDSIESSIKSWNYSGNPLSLIRLASPQKTDVMIYYSDNFASKYEGASY